MKQVTVRFLPADTAIQEAEGGNLLDIAMDAGVHINAACGGEGVCGKCRVRIDSGTVACTNRGTISPEEYESGYRLACQCTVIADACIYVPESEKVVHFPEQKKERRHDTRQAAVQEAERRAVGELFNPPVKKYYVSCSPPTLEDNASDLSRLLRALKQQHGISEVDIDCAILHTLPGLLREAEWSLTAALVQQRTGVGLTRSGQHSHMLVHVEKGDATGEPYCLAFDIGTTSLWGQLIDLQKRAPVAEASSYNPQIQYGEDVISRIVFSGKRQGLGKLQQSVVKGINELIEDLCAQAGIAGDAVSHVAVAGNTVMTHLFAGLDPRYIREAPYTPVANVLPPMPAGDLGLAVAETVQVYTFPSVASYVGGDIVAGVLGTGMHKAGELTLYMDVGTNGEIVVGNADFLITASCSAGPAFEGGGLRFGMRAARGAIERFHINPATLDPMVVTIGRERPRGICGSGAITILAEFLQKGILDQNGKFNRDCTTPRLREGPDGMEYVLVDRENAGVEDDIVITEPDIDNLLRAKAAMFAGCQCLLDKVGLGFSELERVIIAGAFGDFIDLDEAVMIGLLPEIPTDKFLFIGNGSLLGARLVTLSRDLLDEGEEIGAKMTNIELSEDHSFMDKYMGSMFFPHTNTDLFPGTCNTLAQSRKIC
jgi:uncharacterized 2Fe-2S/4Fe-4S cluster protein (DUF4445 family)